MPLKLVYRFLRKISDWMVDGFYSEVYLDGQENVSKEGPLIIVTTSSGTVQGFSSPCPKGISHLSRDQMKYAYTILDSASTHHNEIIDIATLAVTIPFRRHLSFWAKSTMFANPVTGAILSSSGAIPVRRNPNNNGVTAATPHASSSSKNATSKEDISPQVPSRSVLFQETSKALASNQVVGVFPEGTSYTQASIVQVMPGAAWAAVEYARYVHDQDRNSKGKEKEKEMDTGLKIVPVAIVYTDKSRYQSRICVTYGQPIVIDSYAKELFQGDPETASKLVVKQIMTKVEKQLKDMTINAPDWNTLCAATMARNILWSDDQNVPLRYWVAISQRLVEMLALPPEEDPIEYDSIVHLKAVLTKYYALLHYTDIKHSVLTFLLPIQPTSSLVDSSLPRTSLLNQSTQSILSSLPLSLIQLILFIPPLLLHLPGYITGYFAIKFFGVPREEETYAQFKAIGGGLGIGANLALILGIMWSTTRWGYFRSYVLPGWDNEGVLPLLKRVIGLAGTIYWSVFVLFQWHKLLIKANHRQLQRVLTYRKLLSTFSRKDDSLSTAELAAYVIPPPPAPNIFIKRASPVARDSNCSDTRSYQPPKVVSSRKLIRHLLDARTEASTALSSYLMDNRTLSTFLSDKGGHV